MAWIEFFSALAVLFFLIFIRSRLLKHVYQTPSKETSPSAKEKPRSKTSEDPFDKI